MKKFALVLPCLMPLLATAQAVISKVRPLGGLRTRLFAVSHLHPREL